MSPDLHLIQKALGMMMYICAQSHYIYCHVHISSEEVFSKILKKPSIFLQSKLLSSCAKIDPKRQKLQKSVKIEKKNCQKTLFSYTLSNILQFGVNLSAPNLKWRV